MTTETGPMATHPVVSREKWIDARRRHLIREKEMTRLRDELYAERRALPWVGVDKDYCFAGPDGRETLAQLFGGNSQLIVHHFMFGPGWKAGCPGCSFTADHIEGARIHLEHHGVSLVRVSRAPLSEIAAYGSRMGWGVKWVSSFDSDFNFDFHVSFKPGDAANGQVHYNFTEAPYMGEELSGISVFYKDVDDAVYHTYSTFARGDELVDTSYMLLDMTPKGRNETGPNFNLFDWVKRHDEYGPAD